MSHAVWRLVFFDIIIKLKYRESGGSFNMKHICLPDIPEDLANEIYKYRVAEAHEAYEASAFVMVMSTSGIFLFVSGVFIEAFGSWSCLELVMTGGLCFLMVAFLSHCLYRSFKGFFSYIKAREICLSVLSVHRTPALNPGGFSVGRLRPPSAKALLLFWTCVELGGFLLAMFQLSVFKTEAIGVMIPLVCFYMASVFALLNYSIFRWMRMRGRISINKGEALLTEDPKEVKAIDHPNLPNLSDLSAEQAEDFYIFRVEKANKALAFAEKYMMQGVLASIPLVVISVTLEMKIEALTSYEMAMALGLALPLGGWAIYRVCTAFGAYAVYLKSKAIATIIDGLNWGVFEDNFGNLSRVRSSYVSSAASFKLNWGLLVCISTLLGLILLRNSFNEVSNLLQVLTVIYSFIGGCAFSFFLFRSIKSWATKKISENEIYEGSDPESFKDSSAMSE